MTPERWQRIHELFAAALARPDEGREEFLAASCEGDGELREEVASLLAAHGEAGAFIETPAFRFDAVAAPGEPAGDDGDGRSSLAPGLRLGPYEILGLLGAGGMGEVYRALDPRLGREVAIKILPRQSISNPTQLSRFEQEARAAGALNHPNLLAIYDVGSDAGVPYVVTELLEGETLAARLARSPLSPREALDATRQIASGLAAAHEKGIVHRDLKPGNLFLLRDGRLKILDFGLAKKEADADSALGANPSGNTAPGAVIGTVGYMSPEQLKGQRVDARADIFAFGAVFYEMLAGRRAFVGGSSAETLSAILTAEPPPFSTLGKVVPMPIDALVRRCLGKDPNSRPARGRELATALADLDRELAAPRSATLAEPMAAVRRSPKLAVLPFRDLADDPANAHLGLGLADATITELAHMKALVVRPTSAIMRFRDRPREPLAAARELGVEAVVDGSFQRSGSRLRVTVQLVSAEDGRSLWATKIDTSLDDLFRMQDEVSLAIARALEVELSPGEERRLEAPRAARAPAGEVYELYLKGRVHLFVETLEECLLAVDAFSSAVAADPAFALGWAGLADAYSRIAFTFLPEGDWYARAWEACEKALALDPELPEALYVRGGRLLWSPQRGFDHAGALRDLVPALAARPGLEEAHVRLGVVLHHVGLIEEVEEQLERALLISPEHALARQHQGLCLYSRGRFAEALAIYETAVRKSEIPWVHYRIALCQIQLGRLDDADRTVARFARDGHEDVLVHPLRGLLAALRGDAEAALEHARRTVERRRELGHYHHAQFDLACIDAQLGRREEAVGWLRETAANGFPCLPDFAGNPLLAALAGLPSYEGLLAEVEERRRGFARLYAELKEAAVSSSAGSRAEAGATRGPLERAVGVAPGEVSVAVLPFRDLAGDPAHEHLSVGLAQATIDELARYPFLRVRPTASILRYQDAIVDAAAAAAAGRELGVTFVVDASFARTAREIHATARLFATEGGEERGDLEVAVPLGDLAKLPPALAIEIARRLGGEAIASDGGVRALPAADVFDLCLRGRVHLLRETLSDLVAAVDCFERARECEAGFAPASAGLADAYARLAFDHQPAGDWYRRALAMCDEANRLDPLLPEGRYVRARLLWSPQQKFDHEGALRELMAALAARPTLLEARLKLASILVHVGLLDEAEREYETVLAESPGHANATGYFGLCRYAQGRFDEAHALTEAAANQERIVWFPYQLGLALLQLGRLEEAQATAGHTHAVRGLAAALSGDGETARREADRMARDREPFGHFHHSQYDIACIHALLGEREAALDWLTAAAKNGFPCAPQFANDPWLAGVRDAPRFRELLAELDAERSGYAAIYSELGNA